MSPLFEPSAERYETSAGAEIENAAPLKHNLVRQ